MKGLLLLTNDGDLANRITSASSHVPKTYLVKVNGTLTPDQEQQFREGIPLHGRRTAPAGLRLVKRAVNPWYEVRLIEGRQNQVRIMFKHFGRLVEKLKRTKIGFLELGRAATRRSASPDRGGSAAVEAHFDGGGCLKWDRSANCWARRG